MAITTLTGVESGLAPALYLAKSGSTSTDSSLYWLTSFYSAGYPPAAVAPTPGISGTALTSYTGQIPFTNPVSGNTYLAGLRRPYGGNPVSVNNRTLMIVDRMWHNSGIDLTVITAQPVNSVTFPARDLNQSTNGEGVYLWLEVSSNLGSGSPVVTVSYTNSAGVSGRTSSLLMSWRSAAAAGHVFPLGLETGDTGVRSIQSITFSVAVLTGALHLVAYRPIAMINASSAASNFSVDDALTLAMPQLWNNSVPQNVSMPQGNGTTDGGAITVQYAQG